jgi:relaxase-like protein
VIIEGKSRGKGKGGSNLAAHLIKPENDRIRIVETRHTLSHDDLEEIFSDWQTIGDAIGCKKPLYHANIDPDGTLRLSEKQKLEAVDRLEKALGYDNQPRVIIEHEKKGREHLHVVWLRVDTDRMRVLSDSWNYPKHERVATELEREFSLPLTQRALTREEGQERPRQAPTKAELQQAQRSGLTPQEARRRRLGGCRARYRKAAPGCRRCDCRRRVWRDCACCRRGRAARMPCGRPWPVSSRRGRVRPRIPALSWYGSRYR